MLIFSNSSVNGTELCYNISINNDVTVESNETFLVLLSSTDVDVNLQNNVTTVTILDDRDMVNISLEISENVQENVDQVMACVVLSSSATTEREIILILNTENGTAISGEDYEELLSIIVTFSTGSANGSQNCYNISIIDDSILEPNQFFSVILTTSDSGVNILNGVSQIYITDNDEVEVLFPSMLSVSEDAGVATICVSLSNSSQTQREINFLLNSEDGSAVENDDYNGVVNESIILSNSSKMGAESCYNISIINDMALESNQTFLVTVISMDSNVNLQNNVTIVNIVDDGDMVDVYLVSAENVPEDVGEVMVCVNLSAVETIERDFIVELNTENESAIDGEDYVAVSSTILTFLAGSINGAQQCYNISIIDDSILEPDQSFSIILTTTDSSVTIQNSRVRVNIMDNDEVRILFPRMLLVAEDDGIVSACVSLSSNSSTQREIIILLNTEDESAIANEDFLGVTNQTIFISNYSSSGTEFCYNITINNDMTVESNETFVVYISTQDSDVIFMNNASLVTITDDGDMVTVYLSPISYNLSESSGSRNVCAVLSTNVNTQRNISLVIGTQDDTAIENEDYTPIMSTLTFQRGSGDNDTICTAIAIINDNIFENDQQFFVVLSTEDTAVEVGNNRTIFTITDNEVEVVAVSSLMESVDENEGFVTVCLNFTTPEAPQKDVVVTLSTMDESAVGSEDYITYSETLTIDVGVTCTNVSIISDSLLEDTERFFVVLTATDPQINVPPNMMITTVEIFDDDSAVIGFENETIMANEGNGSAIVCVRVEQGILGRNVTLSVETAENTATAGIDYVSTKMNFTMIANQSVFYIIIVILNDSVPETSENFSVQLNIVSSPTGITLSPNQSFVTIGGSFISLEIEQAMITSQLDGDISLICSINYESVSNQIAANPSLTWSTDLAVNTTQQTMIANQQEYLSILNITEIDASFCGVYTCTARDNFVAQESTNATIIDVVPIIRASPVDVRIPINTEAVFTCSAAVRDTMDNISITWAGPVSNLPAPTMIVDSSITNAIMSILTVNITDDSFVGNYNCTASYTMCQSSVTSNSSTLSILPPPTIEESPLDVHIVDVGETVIINCTATVDGNLSITWTGPQPIESISEVGSTSLTSIINITITGVFYGGVYTCIATNEAGSTMENTTIFVNPQINSTPSNLLAETGDEVILFCLVQNQPLSNIRWEKLNLLSGTFDVLNNEVSGNLTFRPVMFGNEGSYRCVVSFSQIGDLESSTGLLTVSPQSSVIIQPGISQVLNITSSIILFCQANGGPNNTFSWRRQSSLLATTAIINVTIANATDGGIYRCTVSNAAGSDFTTILINVFPVIVQEPISQNVTLLEGNITLICEAAGFPIPAIEWFHNGSTVLNNLSTESTDFSTSSIVSTLSVTMAMINDSGEYVCEASSTAGSAISDAAVVLVQNIPEQPVMLMATNVSSRSIILTWVEPHDNNAPIQFYLVKYSQPSFIMGDQARNVSTTEEEAFIPGLFPGVEYNFTVTAVNDIGRSRSSDPLLQRTLEEEPDGFPPLVNTTAISARSVYIQWDVVLLISQNGIIVKYEVLLVSSRDNITVETTELNITIDNLTPHTVYNITVRAFTSVGPGPFSIPVFTVLTLQSIPGPVPQPLQVLTADISSSSAVLAWMPPENPNGIILSYTVKLNIISEIDFAIQTTTRRKRQATTPINIYCVPGGLNATNQTLQVPSDMTNLMVENLAPFAKYEFSVGASTEIGQGNFSIPQNFSTLSESPSAVQSLSAEATGAMSVTVTWNIPVCPNGMIEGYMMYYAKSDDMNNSTRVFTQDITRSIDGLLPFTNYTIQVQAIVQINSTQILGENSTIMVATLSDIDGDFTPTVPALGSSRTYTITNPLLINTGRVVFCAVIAVRGTLNDNLAIYNEARPYTRNTDFYITAAWGEGEIYAGLVPSQITIGAGEMYTAEMNGITSTYTNEPLKSNTQYHFFTRYDIRNERNPSQPFRVFSSVVTTMTDLPYNEAGLAVGLIVIIATIIAIVIFVILVVFRYRSRFRFYGMNRKLGYNMSADATGTFLSMDQVIANPGSSALPRSYGTVNPIKVEDFKNHVTTMHSNDDYLFSEEYSSVEPPNNRPSTEATHAPYNAAKNRYANIPCYDHSRVHLSVIPGRNGSDYINANYIDGYNSPKGFIATQGPVPDSVPDFWRLVWEQNIQIIVMVTNLEERGRIKCHQYWPSEKVSMYENFRVQLQEELELADYTIRTMSIQYDQQKTERIVTQFHFTVWPDHGVPEHPTSLLQFVRRVMTANSDNAPVLVHCSAGVGRTGTFISLYTQLQRIQAEDNVDIFNFVRSMRYNRCCMVQTEPQYIFIHDALLEAIQCGVTDVVARNLKDKYHALGKVDEYLGLTGLEIEYDKLETTVHRRNTKNFASLNVNKPKNRYANMDMLPYDNSRVRLTFIPGIEGSDYINANYINGYLHRKAYIATQGPLPDTTDDFWRMVWEQKCATIVMLTRLRENDRVKCHRYWPDTGAGIFGHYQVILHNETNFPDYILRELKIVDTRDGSSLPVRQFHSFCWPEEGVPDTSSGLIDLIGQVQKWQMNSGNKPIVVHCSGGIGRTGTFIAVSILLERLKTEGVVDVFHTVRALRLQRPSMVQTVDQYEFCYKTVLEYLESFELYANFK